MKFYSHLLTISQTPSKVHCHSKIILKKAREISEKLGIADSELYNHHTTMTNYVYNNAPVHKMITAVVFYDVLYFMDDFFGEDTQKGILPDINKVLNIWAGNDNYYHSSDERLSNLYKGLGLISSEFRNNSSKFHFNKLTKSISNHLQYSLSPYLFKSIKEYFEIRLHTGGMLPVIDLIEYMYDIYLTEELIQQIPELSKIRYECALIGGLSNDIFSYPKEKHSDYNLINVIIKYNNNLSLFEATKQSIEEVNLIHQNYQNTHKTIQRKLTGFTEGIKQSLTEYLNALDVVVSASYHWQKSTKRYMHEKHILEDMKLEISYS
ncbi:terpene synthase family protein [Tenacibaculum xiamenense]|uniref:terpene synthase family protein n=1 Tax=Tenacibaculum xiamenense TaxID=1261553 RepID=UPI003896319F